MFLRSLPIVFVVFTLSASTDAPGAESMAGPRSCSRQVVGETVVCAPSARPAPMATFWANSYLGRFCYAIARDTKRNNCWPESFLKADRLAVRAPFVQMVANGWRRQNTLGDFHFVAETGKLNRAGQLKIRKILLEGLPQHRYLYVHRAERANETAARVASIRQYAAQTVRDGSVVQVFETDIPAPGWPAQWVDLIETKTIATMPDPRLPKAQAMDEEQ